MAAGRGGRLMSLVAKFIALTFIIISHDDGLHHYVGQAQAQRSLHHWKHDIEHRIRLYKNRRNAIQTILASSIYPGRDSMMFVNNNNQFDNNNLNYNQQQQANGGGGGDGSERRPIIVRISSNGNVRFSDLVIPRGSLKFGPHIVESTVRIMINKTRSYAESKSNELSHIQSQLDTIQRQLDDPNRHYIYKGLRNVPQPYYNATSLIGGTRIFKRVQYAHLIDATSVSLPKVNYTDVSRVIDDTYMRNSKLGVFDSQNRLYFEGRKTFWNSVFTRPLKSGCCDRLKPLHTSRMMLRSQVQDVNAPILLHSGTNYHHLHYQNQALSQHQQQQVATIGRLLTPVMYNKLISLNPRPPPPQPAPLRANDIGLLMPLPTIDNLIRVTDLISTRQFNQPEVLKTIVFRNLIVIDEALLSNSFIDNRLVIGLANQPGFAFDLAHDNYLLKFFDSPRSYTQTPSTPMAPLPIQRVSGTVILEAGAHFLGNIQASSVNRIDDFARFVHESIVTINRPATIRGPIQFNALPAVLDNRIGGGGGTAGSRGATLQVAGAAAGAAATTMGNSFRRPQNVVMLRASRGLEVGRVNGMQIPADIVLLPTSLYVGLNSTPGDASASLLKPNDLIHVRGSRLFANKVICSNFLQVSGLINNIQMPAGVVPLHLNDFINSAGESNLWFMDGVSVHHMTIQGGKFDEINLRDVNGDAQSIIMRSMLSAPTPDGSLIIRAPLQVTNLNLIQMSGVGGAGGVAGGLLNGFRPQEVLELNARYPYESLWGRKRFVAPVEATECIFSDINSITNWTNHLIRIDRPNTVQTVHTKLAFNSNQQQQQQSQAQQAQQPQQQQQYLNQSSSAAAAALPQASALATSGQVYIDRLNVEFYPENGQANYELNWNFSPGFYLLHKALLRGATNYTGGRYRVLDRVKLIGTNSSAARLGGAGGGFVNGIALNDIVRLDEPFRFADTFTMVGKVEVSKSLSADRIHSNYPIDAMDLVQFNKYRIPIISNNSRAPIKLNRLVLGENNQASFVQCRMLNGISLNEFIQSIMSLTKPQLISNQLTFNAPINFEAMLQTRSSLNGVKNFNRFARSLKSAKYVFDDGLQCNAVIIRTS